MEFSVETQKPRSPPLDEGRAALARAAAVERRAPDEALALADGVLAMPNATRHVRAEAMFQRARSLIFRRDIAAAAEAATSAEGMFIELDDVDGIVRARTAQGAVFSTLGHDEAALELLDDSANLSWSPRVTPMTRMKTLTSRASALRDADRAEESLAGYDQALSIARELGRPAEEVIIDTDAPALSRIVENLLTNALKFTPPGRHVRVTLRRESSRATLHVDDDGPGFQPGELGSLFELGTTGAARPTAGEASSGIGLSVVRDLVVALGGEVKLDNRDGGARVTVRLPA